MKNSVHWLRTVLCVLVFFTACSPQNRIEGYLYYRLNTNPTTLDPAFIVDVTGGSIAAKLFNGLVKIGKDLTIEPDIAENWTLSADGLHYTFQLKEGVKFSNGRTVTARDFKYSFERILHPENRSPATWVFEKILGAAEFIQGRAVEVRGIQVLDDHTLAIRLKRPFSPFLNLMAMTSAYVVPREEVEKWGPDFSSHPIGTGPFLLKEWQPNREIRLDRRTDYFDRPAKMHGILYRIIPEDLTAVSEFELGNLDLLTIPAAEYARYRRDPSKRQFIASIEGLNTYYLGFNCSRPPFDNPRLRKAVASAIDREKILNTIYEKRGRLADGPVPDIMRKWALWSPYRYDPQKAREIIAEEGFQNSTVNFYITADQEIVDIAEVIQSYLMDAGLNVQIKQLEWSAYKESLNRGEADLFYLSWWADYPDPENFLFPLFHSANHGPAGNRTRYTNAVVDALIEQGRLTMDEKKRNALYQKAEELIVADSPWVFLWHRTDFIIRQPRVKNYTIQPIYSMDKGTEISF
ncbi:MAG: ABC transporter substrate-binding protein [Thermodesulfovibrionales bacterium]|nr:ABC transporter substrate-binding protein [Thermodesulfovibrionales bacterium]